MAQVSTYGELRTALGAGEASIQVTADIPVTSQLTIGSVSTVTSIAGQTYTLRKTANFSGSLFRIAGGELTLENIVLDGTDAGNYSENIANRSLVLVTGGTLRLGTGAVLQNNSSYQEGGGVYLSGGAEYRNTLYMEGNARITGCSSRTSGGGLMLAFRNETDSAALSGQAVFENNTADNGGGIYCRSYLQGVGSSLTVGDQVRVTGNSASSTGGGICFSGFRNGGGPSATLIITGQASVDTNQATHGGGIYFYGANMGDRFQLTAPATVRGNIASGNGGGIFLTAAGGADVAISGIIENNTGGTGGGGYILTTSGGAVTVSAGRILNNHAVNGASGSGGGLWLQNSGEQPFSLNLSDAVVTGNDASAAGGGVRFTGTAGPFLLNMSGGIISENTAVNHGGGMVLGNRNAFSGTITGSQILKNTCQGSGGGIYFSAGDPSGTLSLADVAVSDNSAGGDGGGMRLISDGSQWKATVTGSMIAGNMARDNGGGISVARVNMELGDEVEIANNSAGKSGGGLSVWEDSTTTMAGGSIHDNTAGFYGGGIYNHTGSVLTQTDGDIFGNHAASGGGIYNDAVLTLSGEGRMGPPPNTADDAPGIYNTGAFHTQGQRALSNGLYIANRDAVARLDAALDSGSLIQMDNTPYVSPNPEGTPIVVGEGTLDYPLLEQRDADAFQKPSRDFDGWEIRLSADKTQILLAPMVYLIVYQNLQGAQNPNPDSYTVTTAVALKALTLSGNHFLGWYDAPLNGNRVTEIPVGSTGNRTLYARWEAIIHAVTYEGNDTGGPQAQWVPSPVTVFEGDSVVLSRTVPVREGYRFIGWNTGPLGDGTMYFPGYTIENVAEDIKLYAQWQPVPQVNLLTYHGNDAGGPLAQWVPSPVPFIETTIILSIAIPTRSGYRFQDWNTAPDGSGTRYHPGETLTGIEGDLDLYAQWQALPPKPCQCCRYCPYCRKCRQC